MFERQGADYKQIWLYNNPEVYTNIARYIISEANGVTMKHKKKKKVQRGKDDFLDWILLIDLKH